MPCTSVATSILLVPRCAVPLLFSYLRQRQFLDAETPEFFRPQSHLPAVPPPDASIDLRSSQPPSSVAGKTRPTVGGFCTLPLANRCNTPGSVENIRAVQSLPGRL